MAISNKLKFRLRRGLGVIDLQSQVEHLENHLSHIEEKIEANQQKMQADQQKLLEIFVTQTKRDVLQDLISESQPGSLFTCLINDVEVLVPVEMLKNYVHCLHPTHRNSLTYWVETHCSNWIASQINSGDTVLDVGAAYGVISLPLARFVGREGRVYAFEPAHHTRRYLETLIKVNDIDNIVVVPYAISDQIGTADFIEYTSDNQLSWASDKSSLSVEDHAPLDKHLTYSIEITTIDCFIQSQNIQPKAIKIDIEGFEFYALQGAKETLEKFKPALCIDIHEDVKTKQSALLGVQPFLENLGYECKMNGHTLFAAFK